MGFLLGTGPTGCKPSTVTRGSVDLVAVEVELAIERSIERASTTDEVAPSGRGSGRTRSDGSRDILGGRAHE